MSVSSLLTTPKLSWWAFASWLIVQTVSQAGTNTWDAKYDTSQIDVSIVYFVPQDRQPLADWKDRVTYFGSRLEQFHRREFGAQSRLRVIIRAQPLSSEYTTQQLRAGDADAIYYRTLREVDERIQFARDEPQQRSAFPILLVLSDINWRPLDDFYRLHPSDNGLEFEGNYSQQQHFPGATSGGARAAYLAGRGVGWGLVSADGWRVPYRGSDCVVYHEGCGHTVGLPHPEPGNGSVMSQGQYRGWINESWLDKEQKVRLGWKPEEATADTQLELFTQFTATPKTLVPQPGEEVLLSLSWPQETKVKSLRVRYQTAIDSPWVEVTQQWNGDTPEIATLNHFDRATPVSYRVDAELVTGETAELWGYLQVRDDPGQNPQPYTLSADLLTTFHHSTLASEDFSKQPQAEVDLLARINLEESWAFGEWSLPEGKLLSPKTYGARIELPGVPPSEYRLNLIVEPLDEPNGLIVGVRKGEQRFVALYNYLQNDIGLSAIENIRGRNVGNETTVQANLFQKGQLSQVIVTVRKNTIQMQVDGKNLIVWSGPTNELSLSDYWKTPRESALFLGAYDCRYRFHRITLESFDESSSRDD